MVDAPHTRNALVATLADVSSSAADEEPRPRASLATAVIAHELFVRCAPAAPALTLEQVVLPMVAPVAHDASVLPIMVTSRKPDAWKRAARVPPIVVANEASTGVGSAVRDTVADASTSTTLVPG